MYYKNKETERIENRRDQSRSTIQTVKKYQIVVPYSQGLCESYKTICRKYGVQVHFKGENTLKYLLMFPKDKEAITKQNNIIYWSKCGKNKCNDEYKGELARTFEEQYKEHLKAPSPFFEQQNTTGHTTAVDNFKIIGRQGKIWPGP